MKLRIRNGSITKVLTLQNESCTIQQLKTAIQDNLSADLNLSSSFNISLNGSTSIGPSSNLISSVGVVAGDLIKIIPDDGSDNSFREQAMSSSSTVPAVPIIQPVGREREVGNDGGRSSVFLLQDYKQGQALPPNLNALYQSESVKDRTQMLVILLHNLMLESGFLIQTDESQFEAALQFAVVCLEYTHPGTGSLVFTLTCNKLGSFLLVNGIVRPCVNTDDQVVSLNIKLDDYITKFTLKPQDSCRVYKNVSRLARIFKSEISHKALDNMRAELNLPPLHGFLSLFPEILYRILSHLDAPSLCSAAQTCRTLSDITNDDILWQPLYLRTFSSAPIRSDMSWKEGWVYHEEEGGMATKSFQPMYKREYLRRQRDERERREYERDFIATPLPFVPNPDVPLVMPYPGHPLGMLGGDQDLDPSFPYGPFAGRPRTRNPPPLPIAPRRPRLPGFNPLPGSRFDPMHPYGGGNFRPGRGGGMMDDDFSINTFPYRPRRRGESREDRFGGGFM